MWTHGCTIEVIRYTATAMELRRTIQVDGSPVRIVSPVRGGGHEARIRIINHGPETLHVATDERVTEVTHILVAPGSTIVLHVGTELYAVAAMGMEG